MLRISEIIGYPVICSDTGKKEGEVKDVLIDLNSKKLSALIIDCGNILHKIKIIQFNDIFCIEKKFIKAKYKKNLISKKKFMGSRDFYKKVDEIIGKEVVSEKGALIGFVQDILFKNNDGMILGLVLTNGFLDDIFSGIQIIPVDKSIDLSSSKILLSEKMKNTILNNIGGLKKFLELE
ncbi:PRC-barrel domain-containing protein [Caminicella sporogenes]|nr:PRC-barrel domain-containing protein [Caminicella sporogenes]RKD27921.1 hypothetical protein BET04_02350 [Caminicella sporogenes]WIF94488.1 PRC-barrel domain-containing protein [Caminicella sporogenes]